MSHDNQAGGALGSAHETAKSAMLRLTTRIAGAQSQKEIFSGLAFGLMDACAGHTGTHAGESGAGNTVVEAGNLSDDAARLEIPFPAENDSGAIVVERARGSSF